MLPKHIDFLTAKENLQRDAHLSLQQRVKKFNMTFDDFHMTYYRIRKLFQDGDIKKRVLNVKPVMTPAQVKKRDEG